MPAVRSSARRAVDTGLRAYMLNIYTYMGLGLGLTAALATAIGFAPLAIRLFFYKFVFVAGLGTFAIPLYVGFAGHRLAAGTCQMLFWLYASLMGVWSSQIFAIYRLGSIGQAFFVAALVFGAMSVYGHVTKRDLTSMGSFFMMGILSLVIAQVVNMFLGSSMMDFGLSALGALLFTGLTAYDTQRLQHMYFQLPQQQDVREKMAIFGALILYVDVINLFFSLLRLTGERK